MAKKQRKIVSKKKNNSSDGESDGAYFLKIVLYIILGSLWVKFGTPLEIGDFVLNGIPLGLMIGLVFAHHDHFQVDRKIEYVLLVGVTILAYFYPSGIVI